MALGRSPTTRHLPLLPAPLLPDHLLLPGGCVLTLCDLFVMASAGRLPPKALAVSRASTFPRWRRPGQLRVEGGILSPEAGQGGRGVGLAGWPIPK